MELATDVRPAGDFEDALAVQPVEPGIAIGLERASEWLQVRAGMFALAIGRVTEHGCRRSAPTAGPVVAHIDPQTAGLRLPGSRREHRNWRIVGMQLLGRHHLAQ